MGGEGFTPASLRAGCATELFRRSQDLALVQWHLRHESQRTLRHYIQELPAAQVRARLSPACLRTCRDLAGGLPDIVAAAHAGLLGPVFWALPRTRPGGVPALGSAARRLRSAPARQRPPARRWARELADLGLGGLGPAWQLGRR